MIRNFSFASQGHDMCTYYMHNSYHGLTMFIKQSSRMPANKLRVNNKTFRLFVIISKYEAVYACTWGTKN